MSIVDERGRLRATKGQPWSLAEIDEAIPVISERIEDALTDLRHLGDQQAMLKWEFERHQATALVASRHALAGEKTSAEDRKAAAMLHVFVDANFPHTPSQFIGQTLTDIGMAKDMAENAYANQRRVLDALDGERETLRTLHVSGREHTPR